MLILHGWRTSILANLRSFSSVFLKGFFLNFKQFSRIIFWIIEELFLYVKMLWLAFTALNLLHHEAFSEFLTKWKLTKFFSSNLLGISKINQGFYIFEVRQENVRKAFNSVIFLEVSVQIVKHQGISLCEIEGFAHVDFSWKLEYWLEKHKPNVNFMLIKTLMF